MTAPGFNQFLNVAVIEYITKKVEKVNISPVSCGFGRIY